MSMPLLTIAIPTYNRLKWLKLSLPEVVAQVRENPDFDLEVVVSDNCSTDGTSEYLEQCAREVPFLRLNRNAANIGGEANFHLLPKLATGRYLYMTGDDDVLEPGALRRILDVLREEPDFIVVNFDVYDPTFTTKLKANILRLDGDVVLHTPADCFARVDALTTSFIGAWVGRREFFNAISDEMYRHFAQFGMSLHADRYIGISRYPNGRMIAASCLRARGSDTFPEGAYFRCFLRGGAAVLRYAYEQGAMPKAMLRERKRSLLRPAFSRIVYQRRKNLLKRAEAFAILREDYGEFASVWLVAVPLMYLPGLGILANGLRRLLGKVDYLPPEESRQQA